MSNDNCTSEEEEKPQIYTQYIILSFINTLVPDVKIKICL